MFEARADDDRDTLLALMHPDVEAQTTLGREYIRGTTGVLAYVRREHDGGPRTELDAHRFVVDGDEVLAYGRMRVIDRGSLADSPAAWRFRVRAGRVTHMAPLRSGATLSHVA
jgi:ketosteroid isomerase-like protein